MPALAPPLAGQLFVESKFGQRSIAGVSDFHTGVDLRARTGTLVYATAAGQARRATNAGGGKGVVIDHDDGTSTEYWHLSAQAVGQGGQRVAAGAIIGYSGASGRVTGPHLHFEYKVAGQPIDPMPILAGAGTPAVQPIPSGAEEAFPLDEGNVCPVGYRAGSVDPRAHGAIPFNIWFNRTTNPDGTINACVRSDLGPGDNVAVAGFAAWFTEEGLPILLNVAVVGLAIGVGFGGVRKVLGG